MGHCLGTKRIPLHCLVGGVVQRTPVSGLCKHLGAGSNVSPKDPRVNCGWSQRAGRGSDGVFWSSDLLFTRDVAGRRKTRRFHHLMAL